MWYQGLTSPPELFPIGYATSADGISWQRCESNPVLIPSADWEIPRHQSPHVILTDSIYHMWYSAGENEFRWQIGYARSTDGMNWEKHPEPVLRVGPYTDIAEKHIMPAEYILYQNYPNPFNSTTTIEYTVGANGYSPVHVDLSIYNTLGQKISALVSEKQLAGKHNVEWNADGLPHGLYFYRITAGAYSAMKKMLLIK
jgi:hypothetical protein